MPWVETGPGRSTYMSEEALERTRARQRRRKKAFSVLGSQLDDRQRLGLKIQTGRDFETLRDVEDYCRENDRHVLEPGCPETKALEKSVEEHGEYPVPGDAYEKARRVEKFTS